METRIDATIAKIEPEQRRWWGWAYIHTKRDGTQVVDHSGDVIDTPEAKRTLENAFYKYVKTSGMGDDQHEHFDAARLIEAVAFTKEKAEMMGITESVPEGLWVGFEARDNDAGDRLWKRVKTGDARMMSIVGRGHQA